MKRLFVDMDGTLTVFNPNATENQIMGEHGYYAHLDPHPGLVNAIYDLVARNLTEVFILSAVTNEVAKNQKNYWLNCYLPLIDDKHRLFIPYGTDKNAFLNPNENDFLLDDFSKNLHSWKGVGIKCRNCVNGTKGTWKSFSIDANDDEETLLNNLLLIMASDEKKLLVS